MKTLLSIITISEIIFAVTILASTSLAFAQEAITGPPPGETLTVVTDSSSYETNDMITILGILESTNDGKPVTIQIFNPTNVIVKSYQVQVDNNGKYSLKINSDFGVTGQYKVAACIHNGCSSTYFDFTVKQTPPVIITQVELDSPLLLMPDNQTCTLPAKPGFINNCRTDLIPGQKVQCYYSLGSNTCEPRHQYTSGTNQSCFGSNASPNAPQWFDLYNTQNKTVQIQLFQLIILQGGKSWGNEGLFPTPINLGPHEKCTFGLGPSDEPLSLDQTNMGFAASYTFEGKNYTASTPPLTDLYNDTRTWQYDGNKWTFAEHNTITIPEFPFAVPILLISTISAIVFYRMKLGK